MTQWLTEHWKDVVIDGFMVLGLWNALIAFLKVMGFSALATWCQKLEDAITAAIKAFRETPRPPMAGGAAACHIVCLMASNALAQTVPDTATLLQKAGAKSGIIYVPATNQAIATNNITLATYKFIDLSAGVARTDGVDVALSVDIAKLNLPIGSIPVLNLVNYCNIGAGAVKQSGVKDVGIGGYASISWKF